jgi:acetyl-CoA carboxylase biotin carboxyl carrier protein
MQISSLEKLIDLVNESGVSGITLETDGRRITIQKGCAFQSEAPSTSPEEEPAHAAIELPQASQEESSLLTHWINAPMVGIFYHSEPPIASGTTVEAGQVVGVIESMKLMNDVRTEENGIVKAVLAEAGLAVEYGQPLFEVEVG